MDELDAEAGAGCLWRAPGSPRPAFRSTGPDRHDRLVARRRRGVAVHPRRRGGSPQWTRKPLISGGGRVLSGFMQRQRTGPGLVARDTAAVAAGRERYLGTGRALPTPGG